MGDPPLFPDTQSLSVSCEIKKKSPSHILHRITKVSFSRELRIPSVEPCDEPMGRSAPGGLRSLPASWHAVHVNRPQVHTVHALGPRSTGGASMCGAKARCVRHSPKPRVALRQRGCRRRNPHPAPSKPPHPPHVKASPSRPLPHLPGRTSSRNQPVGPSTSKQSVADARLLPPSLTPASGH